MKIFISWSKSKSKSIAELFGLFIKEVIQATEPFISTEIEKGTQWFNEISTQLSESIFGIICLTKENLNSPWILFEAGTLFKGLNESRICIVLFGVETNELTPPLSLFNGTPFNKDELLKLFITINNQLEKPLEVEQLKRSFEKNYPDFSKEVNTIISIQDGFPSNKNQRRYGPILERGGFDRISQLADAALYFSRQRFGYKEKLKQHMLRGENIPEFYYYFTEEGAEYWIQMTSDRQYRFQSNSIRLIKSFSNTIAAIIAKYSKDIDFISLGSGDGKKDHHIITELMNNKMNSVMYYPVDISDKLLVECIKNVFLDNLDHRGVRTKAILADITNLHVLKSVYEDRPSPNVFSILGNTFGNSDEAEILENLQQSMYPGDFLLIEVNCDTEDETFFKSNIKLEYSCLPLFILGLSINIDNVDIREMPKNKKRSIFKCAKSFETIYHNVVIDEIPIKEVILGYDHRYNFKLFQSELAEYLDAEVLKAEVKGNVGILLMQKKS